VRGPLVQLPSGPIEVVVARPMSEILGLRNPIFIPFVPPLETSLHKALLRVFGRRESQS